VSGRSKKRWERRAEDGQQAPANSRQELVAAWQAVYGRPPPKRSSTRLLALAQAYHRQVAHDGGLSLTNERKLAAWAAGKPAASPGSAPARKRGPAKGTRLIRVWHGETHVVDLLEDGILYKSRTYPSLSAVARVITGARWSGPRFFGL
jgi:hypothetical protein